MKKFILALGMAGASIPAAALAQDNYGYEDEGEEYVSPAENRAGLRFEGRVFYERIDDPIEEEDLIYEFGNGIGAGLEAGYDVAVGDTIVVGPYFTYDFSSLETCEFDLCFATPEYWAAGIHAGFATGQNGQVFGKIGYGQQTVTLKGTITDIDGTFIVDERETKGGYNFGFGYEHSLGETMYVRGEFGVSESYDIYGFDLQRGLFALSLGARF